MISAHWILSSNTWFQLVPWRMMFLPVTWLSQGCPHQGLGSACCSWLCRQAVLPPPSAETRTPQAGLLCPSPPVLTSPELSPHKQPPLQTPAGPSSPQPGCDSCPAELLLTQPGCDAHPGPMQHPAPTTDTYSARLYVRYQGLTCSRKETEGLQCIL